MTTRDPFVYQGSGKRWVRHVKKHGYDVTTEVLFETDSFNLLQETGRKLSHQLNVVESEDFLNLVVENGQGFEPGHKGQTKNNFFGSGEHIRRIKSGELKPHKPFGNKNAVGNVYEVVECPHCGTKGKGGQMKRWHFDNCGKRDSQHQRKLLNENNHNFQKRVKCGECSFTSNPGNLKQHQTKTGHKGKVDE